MFVVGNNALRSNAPYDALNEAMSSKNQTSVSSFSSMKIYGLGFGPCVELFAPNQNGLGILKGWRISFYPMYSCYNARFRKVGNDSLDFTYLYKHFLRILVYFFPFSNFQFKVLLVENHTYSPSPSIIGSLSNVLSCSVRTGKCLAPQ
jgi:hypothetical protein